MNHNELAVNKIYEDGLVVIENMIEVSIIKKLTSLSQLYIERTLKFHNDSGNLLYNFFRTEDLSYDFLCPELLNNDKLYDIVSKILGKDFILREILLFFSKPDNDVQDLHSDVIDYFEENIKLPPTVVAVHIPIIDFNEANGGTRFVLKTQHEKITNIEDDFSKIVTPEVKIGDCLIRDCRTWHGAGKNTSDNVRPMFVLVFTKDWLGKKAKVSKANYFLIDKEKRHLVTLYNL